MELLSYAAGPAALRITKVVMRIVVIVCLAASIGFTLNTLARTFEKKPQPAGFGQGVLQGALMPMAMPNLAVGQDVIIYAEHNTGVPYKLGYTVGVNLCGVIFFGLFFRRLGKLRKRAAPA